MTNSMYPKFREEALRNMHRARVERHPGGDWWVRQPLSDDDTIITWLYGPYRWRWQARLQLWRMS